MQLKIIILAAGEGSRMKSDLPKSLHSIGGMPMLQRIVQTAEELQPKSIYVIYSSQQEQVKNAMSHLNVTWIEQPQPLGTGHAVMQVMPKIKKDEQVLILYGDVPLISAKTLQALITHTPNNALGLIVVNLNDPAGMGRIIRDELGNIEAIVEEKDATAEQLKIHEINTGIMTAPAKLLHNYLPKLSNKNAAKEYYLTDIIALAANDGIIVGGIFAEHEQEVQGVNSRAQLAELERFYQEQAAQKLMHHGVTIMDPKRFDLRGILNAKQDITIDVNVIIEGKVEIGKNSTIGANCILRDVKIGENVRIEPNCVLDNAEVQDNCIVGPFARIRPETVLHKNVHIGNFVEVKKTHIGEDSKANHLTYLGDANIGKNVNIGAGTITCNYDGANKYCTIIEDGAFIGSNAQLVAPVKVGANATIGAGSTITLDAPPEQLTISRARQKSIVQWQRPKKTEKK